MVRVGVLAALIGFTTAFAAPLALLAWFAQHRLGTALWPL